MLVASSDQLDWSSSITSPSEHLFYAFPPTTFLILKEERFSEPPARNWSGHISSSVSSSWNGKFPAGVGEVCCGVHYAWLFGKSIQTKSILACLVCCSLLAVPREGTPLHSLPGCQVSKEHEWSSDACPRAC